MKTMLARIFKPFTVFVIFFFLLCSCYTEKLCNTVSFGPGRSIIINELAEDVVISVFNLWDKSDIDSISVSGQSTKVIEGYDLAYCDSLRIRFSSSQEIILFYGNYQEGKNPSFGLYCNINNVEGNLYERVFTINTMIKGVREQL